MTRSKFGTRRSAVLLAGLAVAASASLLLSGCGSGQDSSTADTVAAVDGVNADLAATKGGNYSVRNLTVDFKLGGYQAGSDAPLAVALYNDTGFPVTVRVSSPAARAVRLVSPFAAETPTSVPTPTGSATATPDETATPATTAPVGRPATVTIPAGSSVLLNSKNTDFLQLIDLSDDLNDGDSVPVVFDFGGQQLTTQAGIATPLTPVPRGPKVVGDENDEADIAPEG